MRRPVRLANTDDRRLVPNRCCMSIWPEVRQLPAVCCQANLRFPRYANGTNTHRDRRRSHLQLNERKRPRYFSVERSRGCMLSGRRFLSRPAHWRQSVASPARKPRAFGLPLGSIPRHTTLRPEPLRSYCLAAPDPWTVIDSITISE